MADKVTYGFKGIKVFPITGETDGFPTYAETAIEWRGAKESTYASTGEDTIVYADDIEYHVIKGAVGIDGTISILTMPKELKIKALGYIEDTKKALAVGAGAKANLGLIFETTVVNDLGVEDQELHVLYKVTISTPEESNKTKENTAEPKQFTVPFKAMQVTKADNVFSEFVLKKSDVGATVYNAAKTTMYVPDFPVAP